MLRALPTILAMIPRTLRGLSVADLELIKRIVRLTFPRAKQMSTAELAENVERDDSIVIIDTRAAREFNVSHLPRAIHMQSSDYVVRLLQKQKPSKVVLYCSVGFRSSRLAQNLADRQISNVWNLEGSIFEWANEGRALYSGTKIAQRVHPFGRRWAGLLKPGLPSEC